MSIPVYHVQSGLLKRKGRFDLDPNPFIIGTTMPTESNTGSRYGLGAHPTTAGAYNATINDEVITGVQFNGLVSLRASGVVFRDCLFRGNSTSPTSTACVTGTRADNGGATFERCTFHPQSPSNNMDGIHGTDFTVSRCAFFDCLDCVGVFNTNRARVTVGSITDTYESNVRVEGSYLGPMAYFTPDPNHYSGGTLTSSNDNQTHNDAIQIQGGVGVEFVGNAVYALYSAAGSHQPAPAANPTPSGYTAVALTGVQMNRNVGNTGLHTINQNWFFGGFTPVRFNSGGDTADMGVCSFNRFDGLSGAPTDPPHTIVRRSTQTLVAEGNVYMDTYAPSPGGAVLVRTNG